MDFRQPRKTKSVQPETRDVVTPLRNLLTAEGWWHHKIHGSMFQSGLPDLIAIHKLYGYRFIECKHPNQKNLEFGGVSERQRNLFAKMHSYGVGVWILTGIEDYKLLFRSPNWKEYTYVKISRK